MEKDIRKFGPRAATKYFQFSREKKKSGFSVSPTKLNRILKILPVWGGDARLDGETIVS